MENEKSSVLYAYQKLLNETYNLVDDAQIARVGRYLKEAERVLACGSEGFHLIVREMQFRFMQAGVNITAVRNLDMIKSRTAFLDQYSLAFGFLIREDVNDILFFLKEAHMKGAKTVLLTTESRNVSDEYCDEVIWIPSLTDWDYGSIISPISPFLVVLDILYSYYAASER